MAELQQLLAPSLLSEACAEVSHPKDFRRLYGSPSGSGWRSFADIISDGPALDAWFETATKRYNGRGEVAGSLLSLRLAGPVIDLAISLFVVKGWAVPLPADGVHFAFAASGAVTGVALRDPIIVMPESENSGPAVRAYLAEQLAAILKPAFQALKSRTRYGLRGMWGQAADQIAGIAARRSRLLGLDQAAAWRTASELTDAIATVQPLIRMRPHRFVAPWPAGEAAIAVKGTCCLFFKASDHSDEQRYCSNCPLLPDESRGPRVANLLLREYERLLGAPDSN